MQTTSQATPAPVISAATVVNPTTGVRVEGVSVHYPGQPPALDGASFSVARGQRVAVLGPNGAGKSTLFKAMLGALPLDSGTIHIDDRDHRSRQVRLGYVPQATTVNGNFPATVRDVVMMGRIREIGWVLPARRRDWQQVDAVIDRVGMSAFSSRRIDDLSGGQRQRVLIARALACAADVLLLDEPFSGVDSTAEDEIMTTLDTLRAQGVTVLLATHDLSMAATRFDRVLLLRRQVIAYGTAAEVFTPDNFRRAYGGQVGIFRDGAEAFMIVDEHPCTDC